MPLSPLNQKLIDEAADQRDRDRGIQRVNARTAKPVAPELDPTRVRECALWSLAEAIALDPASKPARWCAGPYLDAMSALESIDDTYGADSGRSVVAYLLGNLQQYRGPRARQVKAELKRRLKS